MNPLFMTDGYKVDHRSQYPENTQVVYSNFTPRKSRIPNVEHMTFFGLQYFIKEYLIERFNRDFFSRPKDEVVNEYRDVIEGYLGVGAITFEHIADLHDLGYLPIKIKALPEGIKVPMGTPCLTIRNTISDYFWLTNYLETILSCIIWQPCTSATTAGLFYDNFVKYAEKTCDNLDFVPFQGHDFSFRGMSSLESACTSGAAHLIYFSGTDTIAAIPFLKKYYNAEGFIGCSVPATEHSVMSAGGYDNEFGTFRRIIRDVYPHGIVSVVSDTWDFWNLVTDFLPRLKNEIIERGINSPFPINKVVIRPDTGVPHKIINGDKDAESECERKGLVRCLEDTFGSTINDMGFKELHKCIGWIYGDSINLDEQVRILEGLRNNGYATNSGVLGIGSFTYQYVTRDTFGTVCKATYCCVDNEPREIFKNPKTGGWKKSHRGLLRVNEDLTTSQQVSPFEEGEGLLREVFSNGCLIVDDTLENIRKRAKI
jgi:nicotinamide phosphoribosyltransferase